MRYGICVANIGRYAEHDRVAPPEYERADATWWLESIHDMRGNYDEMLALVGAGPPG